MTKVLAAATADEALAVVGVPHPNFGFSPIHRIDGADSPSLGNSVFYDDGDVTDSSFVPDPLLTAKAIERTRAKIESIKEQIRFFPRFLNKQEQGLALCLWEAENFLSVLLMHIYIVDTHMESTA
jgi:hypothetical protein